VESITDNPEGTLIEITSYTRELMKVRIPEVVIDHGVEVQLVGHPHETPLRLLRSHMIGRLVSTTGVVVKITQTVPKLVAARYVCPKCGAETWKTQRHQYREEPDDPKCSTPKCFTRGKWVFDPTHSRYVDY